MRIRREQDYTYRSEETISFAGGDRERPGLSLGFIGFEGGKRTVALQQVGGLSSFGTSQPVYSEGELSGSVTSSVAGGWFSATQETKNRSQLSADSAICTPTRAVP